MKKIIVIGSPGAGKTTFSKKLSDVCKMPLYYLDTIWHKPDRTHISRDEFDEKLGKILTSEHWIIDGNYSRTLERRLIASDTVFLFDLPIEVCMSGAIERLGKPRPEMPWIDTELDPWLKEEIEDFPTESLPTIYELLEKYKQNREIIIFKSREQADEYIKKMQDWAIP